MQKKSFSDMQCPVARTLEVVGEWWSMLIVRDALAGFRRFDEFQDSLKIAPNMLSTRLAKLVAANLLERRQYCDRPPRFEYLPTESAREFSAVLWTMLAWGNKHCAPEGPAVQIAHVKTGAIAEPVLVDRLTRKPLLGGEFRLVAGPAADDTIKSRVAFMQSRRSPTSAKPASATHRKKTARKA